MDVLCGLEGLVPARAWGFKSPLRHTPSDTLPPTCRDHVCWNSPEVGKVPQVRIGVLGAARITPEAMVNPAHEVEAARVVSVAARDAKRAKKFAEDNKIERVLDDYEHLVEDPEIDAVYNALPNGLHLRWTLAALKAGKHVLCEKPLTANAAEAEVLAAAAESSGLVLMEAFHYRYHPLIKRMVSAVHAGEIGTPRHIEASLRFLVDDSSDVRFDFDLAGGALMDAGCYSVHIVRSLAGKEPEVVAARAELASPEVDATISADLRFPNGLTAHVVGSMITDTFEAIARVEGDRGEIVVPNFLFPHADDRLIFRTSSGERVENFGQRTTYSYQLEAFCSAVLRGAPTLSPPSDSIGNMRVIDGIYAAAGLRLRGT